MLHGLLLILKIAGIILAVLLGIVLAAAAAVLFVPVRYAADAQYDKNSGKKPVLHVRVTWLLHLFRFFMEFDEDFKMRAQVLFFSLYDSERTIEPEIKEQKGKKSKKKQKTLKRTVFDEQSQKSGALFLTERLTPLILMMKCTSVRNGMRASNRLFLRGGYYVQGK